jgi:hypothetical protein
MKKLILVAVLLVTSVTTGCRTCCDDHPSRSYRPNPPVGTPPPPWVPDRPG